MKGVMRLMLLRALCMLLCMLKNMERVTGVIKICPIREETWAGRSWGLAWVGCRGVCV